MQIDYHDNDNTFLFKTSKGVSFTKNQSIFIGSLSKMIFLLYSNTNTTNFHKDLEHSISSVFIQRNTMRKLYLWIPMHFPLEPLLNMQKLLTYSS